MHQLFGKCHLLDSFVLPSQIDLIIKQLRNAPTDIDRLKVIENFLTLRLKNRANREVITWAVEIIKKHAGDLKIAMLAQQLKISQSQLEKRFRKIVGASPKKFASIVRFRHVLNIAQSEINMTQLGLEAGFFDQAHFIKEFKSFTGVTPEQYFRRKQKSNDFLQLQV
jgi:AraC-like DNA-binding protein